MRHQTAMEEGRSGNTPRKISNSYCGEMAAAADENCMYVMEGKEL